MQGCGQGQPGRARSLKFFFDPVALPALAQDTHSHSMHHYLEMRCMFDGISTHREFHLRVHRRETATHS